MLRPEYKLIFGFQWMNLNWYQTSNLQKIKLPVAFLYYSMTVNIVAVKRQIKKTAHKNFSLQR